jgi:UDP-GlcNAc3NAcA epimerase
MTIATVIGARPQFIKASALSRAFRKRPEIREVLIHTGQHYDDDMSSIFFEELEIPAPDYSLGIGSGTHGLQTGRMLEAIERVLVRVKPDCVLVYGDTNSTLAGALSGAKLGVPVAHVEAGVRSFNRAMPEEINRVLVDHISDILFAPTASAVANLATEGVPEACVRCVGDVMYDSTLFFCGKVDRNTQILEDLRLIGKEYLLCTIHRAENTDNPTRLITIFEGLRQAATHIAVVVPLHPRTRRALEQQAHWAKIRSALIVTKPLGYFDSLMLQKNARLIATDSGGVQREAFFCHVPCVTLRYETEWPELVRLGWSRLVPPESVAGVCRAIIESLHLTGISEDGLFGDGTASVRIAEALLEISGTRNTCVSRSSCLFV